MEKADKVNGKDTGNGKQERIFATEIHGIGAEERDNHRSKNTGRTQQTPLM